MKAKLPRSGQRDSDRIPKRLAAGYTGNRELSVKLNQNGSSSGIQYCSKEGPPFEVGGDSAVLSLWINSAPKWELLGKNIGACLDKPVKKPRNPDHYYTITYQNVLKVSLRSRKEQGITSIHLEDTLAAMHKANSTDVSCLGYQTPQANCMPQVVVDRNSLPRPRCKSWDTYPPAAVVRPCRGRVLCYVMLIVATIRTKDCMGATPPCRRALAMKCSAPCVMCAHTHTGGNLCGLTLLLGHLRPPRRR
jgi:hypothetical protein